MDRTTYDRHQVGKEYTVYGIVLYEEGLMYLVEEDWLPMWYPAETFDVVDPRLPRNWCYQFLGYPDHGASAIWGYPELVLGDQHYDDLLERVPEAIRLFRRRQGEMDREFERNDDSELDGDAEVGK